MGTIAFCGVHLLIFRANQAGSPAEGARVLHDFSAFRRPLMPKYSIRVRSDLKCGKYRVISRRSITRPSINIPIIMENNVNNGAARAVRIEE
jgi:hypothetical protein